MEAGFVPLAAIERRRVPCVTRQLLQPPEDRLIALGGRHRVATREPIAGGGGRAVLRVEARRKRPLLHRTTCEERSGKCAGRRFQRGPRSATTRRIMSTIAAGGVSCNRMSLTPSAFSLGRSS